MNTAKYPDLVQRIKPGWGLSIQGSATGFSLLGGRASNGLPKMKILGMMPNGVQLLMPETRRGQEEAQVGEIYPVEESYQFDPCPWGQCDLEESVVTQVTVDDSSTLFGLPESAGTTAVVVPEETPEPVVIPEPVVKTKGKLYIVPGDPDSRLEWPRRKGSQ